ncbi:phosphatase PAP2 family protein [Tenacibaculum tangerinum]|uniref:Phosphatase PAP2 family protein n=1 Tax=Tenacibaculum tangerinum TaxID=3038772 RepID=A0ABY8L571_9FLAO|nr:phosphatase PAP2 family protein [Tenacibaculum tangerinum]WGH76568.1 phosphatase PAP2 family protein [Tenacibaculum tangerinum]
MIEDIIQKDKELLIYLNNLGIEQWDGFWLTVTNQFTWTPLFVLVLFLVFKQFGWKKGLFTLLFIVIIVTFTDQFTNFIKNTTGRIRPCNIEGIREQLRFFEYRPKGKSFWSGHASLSTTITTFMILLLRRHYKMIYLMIFFPLIFGYSRIYLGVHFPIDVTVGYIAGIIMGMLFYVAYRALEKKLKLQK